MQHKHTNPATGHTFKQGNALILETAMQERGYTVPEWMTPTQAQRAGFKPKANAHKVQVLFAEKTFTMLNVAELEQPTSQPEPKPAPASEPAPAPEPAQIAAPLTEAAPKIEGIASAVNLATHAHQSEKPSKAEIPSIIADLYYCEDLDRETLQFHLARLYSQYIPKPRKTARTGLEWVYKAALNPKEQRPHLHHAYADGTWLVANDGHRMHAEKDSRPAGYYASNGERITSKDAEIWTFPDWQRVLPDLSRADSVTVNLAKCPIIFDEKKAKSVACYKVKAADGTTVHLNKNYVDQSTGGATEATFMIIDDTSPVEIVTEQGENARCVIMPMRR